MGLTILNKKDKKGIVSNPPPDCCEVVDIYVDPKDGKTIVVYEEKPKS